MKTLLSALFASTIACAAEPPPYEPWSEPPAISPVLAVGEGGLRPTEKSIRAWHPADAAELAGRYRLIGITDGHGWLDVVGRKTVDGEWRIDVVAVTEWTADYWSTARFENATVVRKAPLIYFEAGRRHFQGHFVQFKEEEGGPRPAVVLGRDVFVRDDTYNPSSYRTPAGQEPGR